MGVSLAERQRRARQIRLAQMRRHGAVVDRPRRVSPVDALEARAAAQAAFRLHVGDRLSPQAQQESLGRERRLLVAAIKAAGG